MRFKKGSLQSSEEVIPRYLITQRFDGGPGESSRNLSSPGAHESRRDAVLLASDFSA